MNKSKEKIDNLKKIKLLIEAGKRPDLMDLTPDPFPFEFIFGLGPEGMTPFEYQLSGKTEGDEFLLPLKKEILQETFQHLYADFPKFSELSDLFYLKIRVVKVAAAETQEIIKALAIISSCGHDHCSCGCH